MSLISFVDYSYSSDGYLIYDKFNNSHDELLIKCASVQRDVDYQLTACATDDANALQRSQLVELVESISPLSFDKPSIETKAMCIMDEVYCSHKSRDYAPLSITPTSNCIEPQQNKKDVLRKRNFEQPKNSDFVSGLDKEDQKHNPQANGNTTKPSAKRNRTLGVRRQTSGTTKENNVSRRNSTTESDFVIPPELEDCNIAPDLIEMILKEIMEKKPSTTWDDIAGLDFAKRCVEEIIVWPLMKPELFRNLRQPPRGLLLFGPPGTGKTLIAKAIASETSGTFFAISSSILTSKWHGQGEKLVRALFVVARVYQPSVIFIDEIDSLLCQRSESEFEGSRRLKTEFLVQLDGAATSDSDRILLIGATNRPKELDEAARRRLTKRLYIPLPNEVARMELIRRCLSKEDHTITEEELQAIVDKTKGYSGADLKSLCTDAAYGPIRDLPSGTNLLEIEPSDLRPISRDDFLKSLHQIRASVSEKDLEHYLEWNQLYGSFDFQK